MEFLQQLASYIETNQLFHKNEKVLLAVSGGVDSIVLAHCLSRLGYDFAIAHCNFQLRGEESEEDQAFVQQLAIELNVPFFYKKFDTILSAKTNGISIQMAARELRYAWFEEIRSYNNYSYITSAHHQNDVVETVLLNLVRGTGLAGFHGISVKNGYVVRPLLFANRTDIEAYAIETKLEWREDSSNSSNKYARNLIRNEVIPLLKKINPSLENTFRQTIEKVGIAEKHLRTSITKKRKELLIWDGNIGKINIELLLAEPSPLFVLSFILKNYGFELETTKQILSSSQSISGKMFLSNTYRLLKNREHWLLKSLEIEDYRPVIIFPSTKKAWLPDHYFIKMTVLPGNVEIAKSIESNNTLLFDLDKIKFPVTLRKWELGDTFSPFGMKGEKKVSDFLVDKKLSIFDKESICILESDGIILAVVGHRASNHCTLDTSTTRIWRIDLNALR